MKYFISYQCMIVIWLTVDYLCGGSVNVTNSRPKAFIHIGQNKAGSSHFQAVMEGLTDRLRQQKVAVDWRQDSADFLTESFHDPDHIDLQHFIRSAKEQHMNVIYSAETLWHSTDTVLERLADTFHDFDVTFVFIYRDSLLRGISSFNQHIKNFAYRTKVYKFLEFIARHPFHDAHTQLQKYSEKFGVNRIYVLDFYGMQAAGKDLADVILCEIVRINCFASLSTTTTSSSTTSPVAAATNTTSISTSTTNFNTSTVSVATAAAAPVFTTAAAVHNMNSAVNFVSTFVAPEDEENKSRNWTTSQLLVEILWYGQRISRCRSVIDFPHGKEVSLTLYAEYSKKLAAMSRSPPREQIELRNLYSYCEAEHHALWEDFGDRFLYRNESANTAAREAAEFYAIDQAQLFAHPFWRGWLAEQVLYFQQQGYLVDCRPPKSKSSKIRRGS